MLFYEIAAIVIGALIIVGGILNLSKKELNSKTALVLIPIGLVFIALGISGFFIPENYEWVYTLSLIIASIISMVIIWLINRKMR